MGARTALVVTIAAVVAAGAAAVAPAQADPGASSPQVGASGVVTAGKARPVANRFTITQGQTLRMWSCWRGAPGQVALLQVSSGTWRTVYRTTLKRSSRCSSSHPLIATYRFTPSSAGTYRLRERVKPKGSWSAATVYHRLTVTAPTPPPSGGGGSGGGGGSPDRCYAKGIPLWGSVYFTSSSVLADLSVYFTSSSALADINVYFTSSSVLARSCGLWYQTSSSVLADFSVYVTSSSVLADVVAYRTSSSVLAG